MKNMIESMRWNRKIEEVILAGQNRNKNRKGFLGYWKLEI
jgi:hypothetical protein